MKNLELELLHFQGSIKGFTHYKNLQIDLHSLLSFIDSANFSIQSGDLGYIVTVSQGQNILTFCESHNY